MQTWTCARVRVPVYVRVHMRVPPPPRACRCLATRARQVQARRLPIGRGVFLRPRHPFTPTTGAGWDPLRRVQACAPEPSPCALPPYPSLPLSAPPPRDPELRYRARGLLPGGAQPGSLGPSHPRPAGARGGSPGRERAAGRAGAVQPGSRRGFRLVLSLARAAAAAEVAHRCGLDWRGEEAEEGRKLHA